MGLQFIFKSLRRAKTCFVGAFLPKTARDKLREFVENDVDNDYNDLHMTVLYIPEGIVSQRDRNTVLGAIREVAEHTGPLHCKITGTGFVGKDEKMVAAFITVENGANLHADLCNTIKIRLGRDFIRDFDFLPHVTIGPAEKNIYFIDTEMPKIAWVTDELRVQFGNGKRYRVKLTGKQFLKVRMSKAFIKSMRQVASYTRRVNGRSVYVPAHQRTINGTQPRIMGRVPKHVSHAPPDLEKQFGKSKEHFEITTPGGNRHLVRKFGGAKRHAYAIHAENGKHVATIHAREDKDNLHITNGHGESPEAMETLLRRLTRRHEAVHSPAVMHQTLHRAFNNLRDDHQVTTQHSDSGAVRYKAQRTAPTLF